MCAPVCNVSLKQEADESSDEEEELQEKEKERRLRDAKVKAEGDTLTVQTTVQPTFDNDARVRKKRKGGESVEEMKEN